MAAVALYRPGPLQTGMVDDFIDCRHGRKRVQYPHPLLEQVLKTTYGGFVYQEQVMQAAQVMGGYSSAAPKCAPRPRHGQEEGLGHGGRAG